MTLQPRLDPSPLPTLSSEIADAAEELASRIGLGEFDDLDDIQMDELRSLSILMTHWAQHARAIEHRLAKSQGCPVASGRGIAICN